MVGVVIALESGSLMRQRASCALLLKCSQIGALFLFFRYGFGFEMELNHGFARRRDVRVDSDAPPDGIEFARANAAGSIAEMAEDAAISGIVASAAHQERSAVGDSQVQKLRLRTRVMKISSKSAAVSVKLIPAGFHVQNP